MRTAAKKDDNHDDMVKTLQSVGFSVMETHQLGCDKPDAVISLHGETAILEIKNPITKGKMSDGQTDFFRLWQGKKIVAYSVMDVLREFGLIK
jgi:hypothetical protein